MRLLRSLPEAAERLQNHLELVRADGGILILESDECRRPALVADVEGVADDVVATGRAATHPYSLLALLPSHFVLRV
jgi:hypothetical protein